MFRRSLLSRREAWRAIRTLMVGADGVSGAALVELAVLLPILIALAVYTIDFGLQVFNKMEVQDAAQAGAQYVIGQVSYDATAISSAVTNATKFTTITPSSSEFCGCPTVTGVKFCAATCDACNTGTCSLGTQGHYVTVTATPTTAYTPLMPFGVISGTYNLAAKSTVRIR